MAELVYPPIIRTALLGFAALGLRLDVRGADRIPDQGGAALVINHTGYLDFIFAGLAAHRGPGRLVRFMAKQEVFTSRATGPLMRGMHHIPVDRAAGAGSYRHAVQALSDGELVGIFPEATISRSFDLKEFKTGAARMALEAGVPLIPVIVWGSHRLMTKDHPRDLGRSHLPVTIEVGAPRTPEGDPATATATLRAAMGEQLAAVQRDYPDNPATPEAAREAWWLPASLGGGAPTPERAAELDAEEAAARATRRAARSAGRHVKP